MKPKIRTIPGSKRVPPPLPSDEYDLETFQQEESSVFTTPAPAKYYAPAPVEYYSQSAEIEKKNSLTGWRLFAVGLLGINVAFALLIVTMLGSAIGRASPTVVTRGNGQTENIDFYTGIDRPASVIKLFAEKTVSEIYSWRNFLPEKGNPPDPGMELDKGGKIPTTVYRYTLALEPEFAESFRKELSQLKEITQSASGAQQVETMYVPQQVGEPESIGSGKWKIKVSGVQLISNTKNVPPAMVRVDLELTVRAVPPPMLSEVSRKYPDPGIAGAVMTARAMGLEITNITNLNATKK
jgi:hypothetical protein